MIPIASITRSGTNNASVFESSAGVRQNVRVDSLIERASIRDFLLKRASCSDYVRAQDIDETLFSEVEPIVSGECGHGAVSGD